jgi:GT2 family glycosyltransferase
VRADLDRYRRWLEDRHRGRRALTPPVRDRPGSGLRMGLLMVVSNPDPRFLRRSLDSLAGQSHQAWVLWVACVGQLDQVGEAVLHAVKRHVRLCVFDPATTTSAEAASSVAMAAAPRCEAIAVMGQHDVLADDALEQVAEAFAAGADVAYSDEDELDAEGRHRQPQLKPDWSPDLLLSTPYLGRLTAVATPVVSRVGGISAAAGEAWEYDLHLRATDGADHIVHVEEVLYHRQTEPTPATSELGPLHRRVVMETLRRRGEEVYTQPSAVPGGWHLRRRLRTSPVVSVIVPFRDEPKLLRAVADSILGGSGYPNIELLLVDNGSREPETTALLDQLASLPRVRVIHDDSPFNWAAINNAAAAQSAGDVLLFLNEDVVAPDDDWLAAMLEHAQRPEVGAVGSLLLYPGGEVQHAGIVLGLGGAAGHVLRGLADPAAGYLGQAALTRNCSAVTGACLMTRRAVFEELGGFDSTFAQDLNDVDYCLRLWHHGYRVVMTPAARLVHHESATRGTSGNIPSILAFLRRWEGDVRAGDPFLNRQVSRLDSSCSVRGDDDERWWDEWRSIIEQSPAG